MITTYDEHPSTGTRVKAGALTGLIAYTVQALFLFMYYGAKGPGWFFAPNLFATWGGSALQTDAGGHTLWGMILHTLFSLLIGIIYGLIFAKTPSTPVALIVGLIAGFILHWLTTSALGPVMNPTFSQYANNGVWLASFLLFGAAHAVYPSIVQRIRGERDIHSRTTGRTH